MTAKLKTLIPHKFCIAFPGSLSFYYNRKAKIRWNFENTVLCECRWTQMALNEHPFTPNTWAPLMMGCKIWLADMFLFLKNNWLNYLMQHSSGPIWMVWHQHNVESFRDPLIQWLLRLVLWLYASKRWHQLLTEPSVSAAWSPSLPLTCINQSVPCTRQTVNPSSFEMQLVFAAGGPLGYCSPWPSCMC